MHLIEVNNRQSRKEFLQVPKVLYAGDPAWVCIPDPEIETIFNAAANPFFAHGEACRWVLKDGRGGLLGRVAAFINRNKAYTFQQPTGGMGFYECIDDPQAANMLFDACRQWLSSKGMQAMDGPVNFSENDNYWGLLVEGFIHPGIGMNYNFPYYQKQFESYGFQPYYEQVTNHLDLTKPFPERFWKIAEWVMRKPGLRFEHLTLAKAEKYIEDLKTIYDQAWVFHENFTPLETEFIHRSLQKARSFLVEEFIWFVYVNDEPAAFFVMFPDINQIFRKLNGRLDWWGKLLFFYYLKRKTITRARVTIMGVAPQFQKMGLESGIFWHMNKVMQKRPWFKELELSWVGDFNLKMRSLHESVGGYFAKKHITYRKLFTTEELKQRSTFIPLDTKEKFSEGQ